MDMIQMNDNLNACVPEVCAMCVVQNTSDFIAVAFMAKSADGAAANANISSLMIRIQSLPI